MAQDLREGRRQQIDRRTLRVAHAPLARAVLQHQVRDPQAIRRIKERAVQHVQGALHRRCPGAETLLQIEPVAPVEIERDRIGERALPGGYGVHPQRLGLRARMKERPQQVAGRGRALGQAGAEEARPLRAAAKLEAMTGGDGQPAIVHVIRPAAHAHLGGRMEDRAVHVRDDGRLPGPHVDSIDRRIVAEAVDDADLRR